MRRQNSGSFAFFYGNAAFYAGADFLHLRQQPVKITRRNLKLFGCKSNGGFAYLRQLINGTLHFSGTVGAAKVFKHINLRFKIKGPFAFTRHNFNAAFYRSADFLYYRQNSFVVNSRKAQLFGNVADIGIFNPGQFLYAVLHFSSAMGTAQIF